MRPRLWRPADALVAASWFVRAMGGGDDRVEPALKLLDRVQRHGAEAEARALATVLARRIWALPAGEEAVLTRAALAAASVRWPALGLNKALDAGMARALAGVIGPDGAPRIAAAQAVRALSAVALARSISAGPADPAVDEALLGGIDALWHLGGEDGGSAEPDPLAPPLPPLSSVASMRAAAVAWGLDAPDRVLPAKGWALYAFRATGLAAVHGRLGARSQRLLFDARDDRLRWDIAGAAVLWLDGGAEDGKLDVARVDGRKARLSSARTGPRRDLLLEGSRLLVRDHGRERATIHLDPGWTLTEHGGALHGEREGLRLTMNLDPRWTWTRTATSIVGQGPPADLSSSFELRA